jgi:hypothetical protein
MKNYFEHPIVWYFFHFTTNILKILHFTTCVKINFENQQNNNNNTPIYIKA